MELAKEMCANNNDKKNMTLLYDEYLTLAELCLQHYIYVNIYLNSSTPDDYRDIPLWSELCAMSGGRLFFTAGTHLLDDNVKRLELQLIYNIQNTIAYECIMKLRMSTHIKLKEFIYGSGKYNAVDDEHYTSALDTTSTYTATLQQTSTLKDETKIYIQLAILYTTNTNTNTTTSNNNNNNSNIQNKRYIRIHNLCLTTSNNPSIVFKGADLDCTVAYLTKVVFIIGCILFYLLLFYLFIILRMCMCVIILLINLLILLCIRLLYIYIYIYMYILYICIYYIYYYVHMYTIFNYCVLRLLCIRH